MNKDNLINVNVESFEEHVLKSNIPVFVDFWAEWCASCRIVAPIIDRLSEEYRGRVKFVKVNVDEAPDLAVRYQVLGIPSLMIFKDGVPVDRIVGAASKDSYKHRIERTLEKS